MKYQNNIEGIQEIERQAQEAEASVQQANNGDPEKVQQAHEK